MLSLQRGCLVVGLGLRLGLDLVFKYSVVFAGNDVMLTCDHAYNSTLHLDLLLLAIFA